MQPRLSRNSSLRQALGMCEAGADQADEVAQGSQRMIKNPELRSWTFRLREEYMQGKLSGGCSLVTLTRVGVTGTVR